MPEETQNTKIVAEATQIDSPFWLAAAHGAIRDYCRWHVAPVITETLTLDGRGGKTLLIPSQRVEALDTVLNDSVDVTEQVKFSRRAGVLTLDSGWSSEVGGIEVTLRHGYPVDEVPAVAGLIVALTKRAAQSGGVVASQAVGPANVRYITGSDGSTPGLQLFGQEQAALEPYRLNWGA